MTAAILIVLLVAILGIKYEDKFRVTPRKINDEETMQAYKHFFRIKD